MMLILRVPRESSSPPPLLPPSSSPWAVLFVNLPEIMSRAGSTVNTEPSLTVPPLVGLGR